MQKNRAALWLKYVALIFVYSSFLTPWLTWTFLQNIEIRFLYVFGDLVIRLGELSPEVNRMYLESSIGNILLIALLVLQMLFIWLSMGRLKHKSGTLEFAAAILGIIPVIFAVLNFLELGFSAPEDFQMSLQPGVFFAFGASLLLITSYLTKVRFIHPTQ